MLEEIPNDKCTAVITRLNGGPPRGLSADIGTIGRSTALVDNSMMRLTRHEDEHRGMWTLRDKNGHAYVIKSYFDEYNHKGPAEIQVFIQLNEAPHVVRVYEMKWEPLDHRICRVIILMDCLIPSYGGPDAPNLTSSKWRTENNLPDMLSIIATLTEHLAKALLHLLKCDVLNNDVRFRNTGFVIDADQKLTFKMFDFDSARPSDDLRGDKFGYIQNTALLRMIFNLLHIAKPDYPGEQSVELQVPSCYDCCNHVEFDGESRAVESIPMSVWPDLVGMSSFDTGASMQALECLCKTNTDEIVSAVQRFSNAVKQQGSDGTCIRYNVDGTSVYAELSNYVN